MTDIVRKIPGSPEPVAGKCGAKLRRSEQKYGQVRYCLEPPINGKARCFRHGGLTPQGPTHPNWKTGEHSGMYRAVLQGLALAKHYDAAIDVSLDLTEQIRLVDARTFELFTQMAEGAVDADALATAAHTVGDAAKEVTAALHDKTTNRMARLAVALNDLTTACDRNEQAATKMQSTTALSSQINEQLYLRKKLVDSEIKRRKTIHEVMTAEQVKVLIARIASVVTTHVTDRKTLSAIIDAMQPMLMPARTT